MLNKLSPVFVTICACIFLKERVDKKAGYRNNFNAFSSCVCNKTKFFTRGYSKFSRTFSAILAGFSYTIIRYLNGKVKSEINVFYFSLLSVICTFPLMMMNFVKPTLNEFFNSFRRNRNFCCDGTIWNLLMPILLHQLQKFQFTIMLSL